MLTQNLRSSGHPLPLVRTLATRLRLPLLLAAIFALASLSACGEDPYPHKSRYIANNSPGYHNDRHDTGNTDVGFDANSGDTNNVDDIQDPDDTGSTTDAGPKTDTDTTQPPSTCRDRCDASHVCIDGECVLDTAARKCGEATDLGELKIGRKTTAEGTLFRTSNVITTSCGPQTGDLPTGAEAVFKFTVEKDARLDFKARWLGHFDGLIAFHTESCETPDSLALCFDHEEQSVHVVAGQTYYMVIELTHSRPDDFTVELIANTIDCNPASSADACTNGVYSRCEGAGFTAQYACADACAPSNKQCLGNACNEAIVVTASTTFTGENSAYSSLYNFAFVEGCEVDGEPIPTPGPDLIFSLPGLKTGQTVTVDAATNDLNSNAIFISSGCGAPADIHCVAVDYFDEVLTWTVPSNGDYFVFIAKDTGFGDHFHYSIDIQ